MNRTLKIIGIISLLIVIPGGFYAGIGIALIKKICYKVSGFKINSLNTTSMQMEVVLKVKNPSHLEVDIHGYNLQVKLNGTKVADIENKTKKLLKSNEVSEISIPIKVTFKDFKQINVPELLLAFATKDMKKIDLSLNGKFIGEFMNIPISKEIKINYTVDEIIKISKEPSMPCDLK